MELMLSSYFAYAFTLVVFIHQIVGSNDFYFKGEILNIYLNRLISVYKIWLDRWFAKILVTILRFTTGNRHFPQVS